MTLTDVHEIHAFPELFPVIVVDKITVESAIVLRVVMPASNILIAFMWAALSCISESSKKKKTRNYEALEPERVDVTNNTSRNFKRSFNASNCFEIIFKKWLLKWWAFSRLHTTLLIGSFERLVLRRSWK